MTELFEKDYRTIQTRLAKIMPDVRVVHAERMGGMTNRTYHLTLAKGADIVARIPGEGTEDMINRQNERISTELAYRLGIDTELFHFAEDGFKVSHYITDGITMGADELRQDACIPLVADVFRTLHDCGVDTGVRFEVFEFAEDYERIILANDVALYDDYRDVKTQVMRIKAHLDQVSPTLKVPCHNDSLCANWVMGESKLFLIDWEYAGMNDPYWDLADVSIEADFTEAKDTLLLEAYFGRAPQEIELQRFLANKIYLDYLWTLWGLTRVPYDGQELVDYAQARYDRLKLNMAQFPLDELNRPQMAPAASRSHQSRSQRSRSRAPIA